LNLNSFFLGDWAMNMKTLLVCIGLFAGVSLAATSYAEAPKGSTGECKDGTYTAVDGKRGACSGHGGVKDWYADKKTEAAPSTTPAESAPTPAPAKPAAKAAEAPAKPAAKPNATPAEAAPGGGPGKVWVNTASKVYHCSGDKWYGKTKKGEYMSETDAKAKGNRPDHGKACS
jgi:hypothetical protein